MEPIPETTDAVGELDVLVYDDDLLDQLRMTAAEVRVEVPSCVGMSVTMLDEGVTLTLVASDLDVASLDAVQYLGGGPCIAAVESGEVLGSEAELLDERQWQLFAEASAARGVLSTLSMPVLDQGGTVVGGVNLYGGELLAFEGHHDQLARICGAWAGGAVGNADLSFRSRIEAQRAPGLLRDNTRMAAAAGVIAYTLQMPLEAARQHLLDAAASSGLPPSATARALLSLLTPRDDQSPGQPAPG